jgi:hypothetical protein
MFGVSVRLVCFGELLKPIKLRLSFNAAAGAKNLFELNRDVT